MIIVSTKSQTITFTYHGHKGRLEKVTISPGKNEVNEKTWEKVKDQYKDRKPYFKGIKEKA